jgi:hypothetical protein
MQIRAIADCDRQIALYMPTADANLPFWSQSIDALAAALASGWLVVVPCWETLVVDPPAANRP